MLTKIFAEAVLGTVYIGLVLRQSLFGELCLSYVVLPAASALDQIYHVDTISGEHR